MRYYFYIFIILLLSCITNNKIFAQNKVNDIAFVTSMTPTEGSIGDLIKIVCKNMDVKEVKSVYFNTIPGSIASIKTSDSLTSIDIYVVVPTGARTGSVYINNTLSAGVFTVLVKTKVFGQPDSDPIHGNPVGGTGGTPSSVVTIPVSPTSSSINPLIDFTLDLPIDKPTQATTVLIPPIEPQIDLNTPLPPTIYGHDILTSNNTIMYVIDVSGSMGWDMGQYTTLDGQTATGCRLDRAKVELIRSINSLPQNFKFDIDSYDCDLYIWQNGLVPATDQNKQLAIMWVNALQPLGATGTGPAMSGALRIKECKSYILLTDGAPNCGAGNESGDDSCMEAHREMIKRNNTVSAVINVFAIGASDGFERFCQQVAGDNGGSCTDVK